MRVAARLGEIRVAKELSQYRLAELSGLSREAIRLIESGARSPSLQTLFLLCGALGVSASTVLRASKD